MAPPTNPRHNRRAWANDERLCKNCGHPRNRHGGNIGKGRFGSSVFCVDPVKFPDPRACGCRFFEAQEKPQDE